MKTYILTFSQVSHLASIDPSAAQFVHENGKGIEVRDIFVKLLGSDISRKIILSKVLTCSPSTFDRYVKNREIEPIWRGCKKRFDTMAVVRLGLKKGCLFELED